VKSARRQLVCVALFAGLAQALFAAPDEEPLLEAHLYDVAVLDDVAVLGRTGGIITLDISDPEKPVELGRMGLQATVLAVVLEDDHAWLAAGSYGVVLVDMSDPAAPLLEHRIDRPGKVREVIPLGPRLLLAENRNGLTVLDVADPARPRQRVSISTRDELLAIALHDRVLATAEEHAGIRLFDVAHPDTPRELAQVDLEGARDVAFVEGRLLVATGKQGVIVFDLEQPRSPRRIGVIPPARSALSVTPYGKLALVGNGSGGVQLVDPLSPDGPRVLSTLPLSGRYPAGRLAVSGHTVFVAADLGGLVVLDVENVEEPVLLHPRGRRMRVRW